MECSFFEDMSGLYVGNKKIKSETDYNRQYVVTRRGKGQA